MRLTLRTMLAYMDEQLDPPQMEEIGAKIRESGVASGMIDRVRSSIRKHRMEAPKIEGRGIGKDANSVAEYLDNVLDKDEIPEIEQLCLNSDMHLAEVAACHQILSQLPGVEFEIGHRLRDRIYDIPGFLTEQAAEAAELKNGSVAKPKHATVRDPAVTTLRKKKKKKSPKVPDYFKAQPATSRTWAPLILTAAVVLIGLAIGAYLTRDQWMRRSSEQTARNNSEAGGPPSNDASPADGEADGESTTKEVLATPAASDKEADAQKENDPPADSVKVDEANPIIESSVGPPPPIPEEPSEGAKSAPPVPVEEMPAESADGDKAPPAPVATLPILASPVPVVAWDTAAKAWNRVRDGESLPAGGAIALVGSRAKVKTESGLVATLVGPSEIQFLKDGPNGKLAWILDCAKVVFDATEAGGSSLDAIIAGTPVSLKFVSPDSKLAIEVTQKIAPGGDPSNPENFAATIQVYLLRGAVQVKAGDEDQLIEAGNDLAVFRLDASGALQEIKDVGAPLWVDELTSGEATKQASKELSDRLANIKTPLSVALQELASDKRINVASLAAQALAQLEEIKPLCDQFRDSHFRSVWRTNHAFLKQLLQSKPGVAEVFHDQLTKHYPSEAEAVFRILRGFDDEQFSQEGGMLIDALRSESQLLRVLAYQTLVDLVGPGNRKFQPEDPKPLRDKNIVAWFEAFEAGKLKVKATPEPK